MMHFLKGMLEGFTIAVAGLLICGIFIYFVLVFSLCASKYNLPWWVSYSLFIVVLYSLIGGIVGYFKRR